MIHSTSISQPLQCNIFRKWSNIYLPDLSDQICQPAEPQNWLVWWGFWPTDLIECGGWHRAVVGAETITRKPFATRRVKEDLSWSTGWHRLQSKAVDCQRHEPRRFWVHRAGHCTVRWPELALTPCRRVPCGRHWTRYHYPGPLFNPSSRPLTVSLQPGI